MAIHRQSPKCPTCGKDLYEAVYRTHQKLIGDMFCGDTFSHWKDTPCKCDNVENSLYEGIYEYLSLNKTIERYGYVLSEKDIEDLKGVTEINNK